MGRMKIRFFFVFAESLKKTHSVNETRKAKKKLVSLDRVKRRELDLMAYGSFLFTRMIIIIVKTDAVSLLLSPYHYH